LLGVQADVENMVFPQFSRVALGLLGRIDVAQWNESNTKFFNLPSPSLYMALGPLISLGNVPKYGFRGSLGFSMGHLFSIFTPVFFEIGFQVLGVETVTANGFRVGVGLGF
jgi:hypothetical protein